MKPRVVYMKGAALARPGEQVVSTSEYGEIFIGTEKGSVRGKITADHEQKAAFIDFGNYCEVYFHPDHDIDLVVRGIQKMVDEIGKSKVLFNQVMDSGTNHGKPADPFHDTIKKMQSDAMASHLWNGFK